MRRAAVVAVAVLAGVVIVATARWAGDDAADRVRAISFNYCGNVCNHGGDDAMPFVVGLVEDTGATVVLLQEVCRVQAEHLTEQLGTVWGAADLHYVTTFADDLGGRNECPDDDYGMAVIGPRIRNPRTLALPNPGLGVTQIDERSMPCADLGRLAACTTHLVRTRNDADAHRAQLDAFTMHAIDLTRREVPTLIAGDLNDQREELASLLGDGPFLDDSPAEAIDHALATKSHFARIAVELRSCECSDHDALVVTLTPR